MVYGRYIQVVSIVKTSKHFTGPGVNDQTPGSAGPGIVNVLNPFELYLVNGRTLVNGKDYPIYYGKTYSEPPTKYIYICVYI